MEIVYIEAVLMGNDELVHKGMTLGFIGPKQRDLIDGGATKRTRGGEPVVEIKIGEEDNAA